MEFNLKSPTSLYFNEILGITEERMDELLNKVEAILEDAFQYPSLNMAFIIAAVAKQCEGVEEFGLCCHHLYGTMAANGINFNEHG